MNKVKRDIVWFILFLGMGVAFLILGSHLQGNLQVEPKEIPLFSCYKIEGTKCTVSSNKENPCSYTVVVCRTPDKKEIFRSEKVPSLIF